MKNKDNDLHGFFYPENVAVVGVSPDPDNLGKNIVQNLLTIGYRGEILSVGIKGGVVFGQRIYESLDKIDHHVDLAVILTPAKTVPDILEQCGRKGIRRVVVESGGFSEMGGEGHSLEDACLKAIGKNNIRVIGPNGIGVTNLENGLAVPFMPVRKDLPLGPVSILAQSGGVGLSYMGFLAEQNIGLNKFVSLGNKLDVNENDLLDYLIRDEGTGIILVYLEGFSEGRRFVETASKSNKPILVHKSNRFTASAQIAHSHTAALFADDMLVDVALEQAGCVRVNTMADAIDYIKILTMPPLKGNRLAVVSRSGGHAVIAADACAHYGFDLPPFPREFLDKVESRFRAKVIHLQNPLDLGDLFELAFYVNIVEEMLKRENIDGVLLGHGYRGGFQEEESRALIGKIGQLVEKYQKPVAVVVFTEAVEIDYLRRNYSIPIFTAPDNAMRAVHLSHQWETGRANRLEIQSASGQTHVRIDSPAGKAQKKGRGHLYLEESLELIKGYGFGIPEYHTARSFEEVSRALKSLDGPTAIKLNRPHVSHKTDEGFVRLNVKTEEEALGIFREFREKLAPDEIEVMIQRMEPGTVEVILGGRWDQVFGPVVMFGLGGVFVEALEDVIWRLAPIHRRDARNMIQQIRGRRILAGMRGEGPSDVGALEDLLIRLSALIAENPAIAEIDINPVMVRGEGGGAIALDARVILKDSNQAPGFP